MGTSQPREAFILHIVIATMSHETNTFSPVITDLDRFSGGRPAPLAGDEAIATYTGTASCPGGYLQAASEFGAEVVVPIIAGAPPSGPVEDDAFEYIAERIVAAAAQGPDAILLDLHGAMVTRSFEDGEGELLRRVRAVAPEVPIGVALDMHANLYPDMVALATVVCGYHTYPHIDMDETALKAGRLTLGALTGRHAPTMAWGNAPMLPHVMRQGTDDHPNQALQARAREMEAEGALSVSLFTGFPHADIHNAGLSVVVVTDNDPALAERYRDELLDSAWSERQAFVYQVEPLAESLARARTLAADASTDGPVLLLDHYDNTASGGTMDTTEVLAEVLAAGLDDVAVFGIYDPEAVAEMAAAGVGAEVTVALGGKLPMPALAEQSRPLTVTGRVRLLSEGRFPATVAMSRGLTMNMGRTAVLRVGGVDIVVISRHIEPFDPGCFRSLGIEPTERRYLMLKSRIHYRVGFMPLVAHVVECAGRGVCTSDYSEVTFEHVRRPIFPLDGVNSREGL
jgi:microcystin degradation protein MlrC